MSTPQVEAVAPETVPEICPVVDAPVKPVFQPYYKPPSEIDATLIEFKQKADRPQAGPVKITTFSIKMKSTDPVEAAPIPEFPVEPTAGRGGRGRGEAPGRGRGRGRGGRGTTAPQLKALAIKPQSSLRTKYGINYDVGTGPGKDRTIMNRLKDKPRLINAIAAGIEPCPADLRIELLVFLDPENEEHQLLEQLSKQAVEQFEEYTYSLPPGMVVDGLETNGFVRVSAKTQERYIVLQMSTMHTIENTKYYPTPFYSQNGEVALWDALVQHSFRGEIEFKVDHVTLQGTKSASFKSYLSSCTLTETPKLAMSETRQAREGYLQAVRASVEKAGPEEPAVPEGDLPAVADEFAALVHKAAEASGPTVVPAPPPRGKRPHSKVAAAPPTGPRPLKKPVLVEDEPQDPVDEQTVVEEEPVPASPAPIGVISNLKKTTRVAA